MLVGSGVAREFLPKEREGKRKILVSECVLMWEVVSGGFVENTHTHA